MTDIVAAPPADPAVATAADPAALPADPAALPAPPVPAREVHQLMALLSRGEQSMREGRWVPCADLRA